MASNAKWRQKHRAYLLTKHWKNLREAALTRDGRKCTRCPSTDLLQVHHLVYRVPLKSGILADVITLCKPCHRKEHGLPVVEIPSEMVQFDNLYTKIWKGMKKDVPVFPNLQQIKALRGWVIWPEDGYRLRNLIRNSRSLRKALSNVR